MKKPPTIFISSAFDSLQNTRQKIARIITEEFGWNSNGYESRVEEYVGPPTDACRGKVDESDLYIGLFGRIEGTSGFELIPITELEFIQAFNSKKVIKLYDLAYLADDRTENLRLFIEQIKDPDTGLIITYCISEEKLLEELRKFLNYFGDLWFSDKESELALPSFLFEKISNYRHNLSTLIGNELSLSSDIGTKALRLETVGAILDKMRLDFNQKRFYDCVVNASCLWSFFLAPRNLGNDRALRLFADFLQMWAGSCTWLGLTSPLFGSVAAAHMLKEVFQKQNQFVLMNASYGLISHTLYVRSRIKSNIAKRISIEKGTFIGSVLGLRQSAKLDLQNALNYDSLYALRGNQPRGYSYGTYIHEALGEHHKAELGFRDLLRFYDLRGSEISYLDVLADYGSNSVIRGLRVNSKLLISEGMKNLRQAFEKSKSSFFETPHYIMIGKELGKNLLRLGDTSGARLMLDNLYAEAKSRKLFQQAETIQTLRIEAGI